MNIVRANRAPPRGGAALRGLRSVLPRDAAQAPLRVCANGPYPFFSLILFFFESLSFYFFMAVADFSALTLSFGHTTVKAPYPIRTAQLSTVGPDQYYGRGLRGNLRCCKAHFGTFAKDFSKSFKKGHSAPEIPT